MKAKTEARVSCNRIGSLTSRSSDIRTLTFSRPIFCCDYITMSLKMMMGGHDNVDDDHDGDCNGSYNNKFAYDHIPYQMFGCSDE